jgi:hypothetical protein
MVTIEHPDYCPSITKTEYYILENLKLRNRLCGYRSRGPGFDSRRYQIF